MDYDGRFIMQKTVDWSLLNDGMTIPVSACALLKAWDESILTHGVCKDIKVLIDGELYDAKLKNQVLSVKLPAKSIVVLTIE